MSGAALAALSPLKRAAEGDAPVLLIQQADGRVVNPEQGAHMRVALVRAKRPVELLVLRSKDQDLDTKAGRLAMLEAMTAFLAKNNPT